MPSVTIYHGDDLQRLGELRTAVHIAERAYDDEATRVRSEPSRFGDDAPDELRTKREAVEAAKAEYDAFVDQAASRADEWIIEPIGHEEWRDLLEKHPARMVTQGDGDEAKQVVHEDDADYGVDTRTFPKALLLFVDPDDPEHRTIVKAADADRDEIPKRVKRLPIGKFETLWVSAYWLNVGGVTNPKAERYSIVTSGSTET